MPLPRVSRTTLTQTGAAALLLLATVGCSTTSSPQASRGTSIADPVAMAPTGKASSIAYTDGLDPIVMTGPQIATRHWVTPTIIDTRTFDVQIQPHEPWTGPVDLVKNHLPKHSRDKTLPIGRDTPMPVGTTFEAKRVSPGASFPSISQTAWIPPDPSLAVGPNHIVETVNSLISFYDKDGNEQFSAQLGDAGNPGFFEGLGAGGFAFDPKCMYDQKTGRFIVVVLEKEGSTGSFIDIAVSDDSDPNGIWYKYRTNSVFQVGNNNFWIDYPGLGFDDDAFYVTGNLFKLNGPDDDGFAGPVFRIFDKAPMLVGNPIQITDIVPEFGASVQVAQSYGPAPRCYFLSRADSSSLRVWTIEDATGNNPSLQSTTVSQLADAFAPFEGAPNLNGDPISTLDGRLMNIHWRNGNLYTAHGIDAGGGGNTKARWYHIATNNWPASGNEPTLVQQGDVEGTSSQYYFFPAIVSDADDNVGMVMARSAFNEFASVQVSGHLTSDPAGSMSAPTQIAIGDQGYFNGRWGDYFDATIDPNDDRTMWTVGMYATSFGWQTWIGSFTLSTAEPCPADFTGEGDLDIFDILAFLDAFNSGDSSADFTGEGDFDIFDILAFLDAFNAGCP